MQRISFVDLTEAIQNGGLPGKGTAAFGIPEDAGFFVHPVLVAKEGLNDLGADVILVSARGAARAGQQPSLLSGHRRRCGDWRKTRR